MILLGSFCFVLLFILSNVIFHLDLDLVASFELITWLSANRSASFCESFECIRTAMHDLDT